MPNWPPLTRQSSVEHSAHAIDRQSLVGGRHDIAATTGGLIPPAVPGHSHQVAPAYDPKLARSLLAEANLSNGTGEVVLSCLDLWADRTEQVAEMLSAVGIPTRILAVATDPEMDVAMMSRSQAYLWAWGVDYPEAGRGILEPVAKFGPLYRDDELDRLLERASSLQDQDERLRLYREFERRWIGEHVAMVPIAYGGSVLAHRPWIDGLWVSPIQISTFAEAIVNRPI